MVDLVVLSGFLRLRIWHASSCLSLPPFFCRPRHIDYTTYCAVCTYWYQRCACPSSTEHRPSSIDHRASTCPLLAGTSQHGSCFRNVYTRLPSTSRVLTRYLSPLPPPRCPKPVPPHICAGTCTGTHYHSIHHQAQDQCGGPPLLGWSFPAHLGARCRFAFR